MVVRPSAPRIPHPGSRFEGIKNSDLRIRDRVGVVIAINRAQISLAAVEIEPLHLEQLTLENVDGFLVERRGPTREIGLADHAFAVGTIDRDEVVGRHRTKADGVGRIGLIRPVPLTVRLVDETFFGQHREDCLEIHLVAPAFHAELLVVSEGQLERRALHVIQQNVQVVGVDERVLGRGVEKV